MPADKPKEKKRAQRATSNVFAMFEQSQIQEFKEAFQMMDQDKDGFISKDDLRDTYASLGVAPKEATLDEMLNEAPGPINFTMFITLFGDKVSGTDPEDTILKAFKMFDPDGSGKISEDEMRDLLLNCGDRLSEEDVSQAFKGAPIARGDLDYAAFAKLMTRGPDENAP